MKSKYISLLTVSATLLTAGTSTADVVTLQPVDDSTITTIGLTGPDTPANSSQLGVVGWLDIGATRSLLKFDLNSIPDGWGVISAVLTLEQVFFHPSSWISFPVEIWRMPNDNWAEATVTWNSYAQTSGVQVAILNGPQTNGTKVWNVTVRDWNYAADLLDNAVTFQMRWGDELSQHFKQVGYSSKEDTVVPTLRIEYVPRLTITRTNDLIIVSWPGPADGWLLEHTNVLNGVSAPWPQVPLPYQDNGATLSMTFTNAPTTGNQFFRLHKP